MVPKSNLDELVWAAGVKLKEFQTEWPEEDAWSQAAHVIKNITRNRELRPRLLRLMQEQGEE